MIYQTLAKLFLICSGAAAKSTLSGVSFPATAARNRKTMNGTQATQIRSLLLEAADAIDRANAIVSALDSDDRALLAIPLDEISSALHFKLLQKLYLRYPGLAEQGEGPDGAMV
jgi:hypothetical protein